MLINTNMVEWLGVSGNASHKLLRTNGRNSRDVTAFTKGNRPLPDVQQCTVVLVDDDIATALTLLATIAI